MFMFFKNYLLLAALSAAFVFSQAEATMASGPGDGVAKAVLDLSTGEITILIDDTALVFGLEGMAFDNDAVNTSSGLGVPALSDATGISWLNFSGFPLGEFNIGPVIPPDSRSLEGVSQFVLRSGIVDYTVGSPGVTVIGIPEPGSMICFTLGCLGCVVRRRRRFR